MEVGKERGEHRKGDLRMGCKYERLLELLHSKSMKSDFGLSLDHRVGGFRSAKNTSTM